jgi:cytochrome P450
VSRSCSFVNGSGVSSPASICSQVIDSRTQQLKRRITSRELSLELFDFFMAGTELPANAISFGVFQLARHPSVIGILRRELRDNGLERESLSDGEGFERLEKLPYLNAIIKETLRLGNLVPDRLPRAVPSESITIGSEYIPSGTIVSGSTQLLHMNQVLFPEPQTFLPARWLVRGTGGFKLDKYLVAFSTGMRDCIGSNLALRCFFACLVLYFDFEPVDFQDCTRERRDNIVACYDRDVVDRLCERK